MREAVHWHPAGVHRKRARKEKPSLPPLRRGDAKGPLVFPPFAGGLENSVSAARFLNMNQTEKLKILPRQCATIVHPCKYADHHPQTDDSIFTENQPHEQRPQFTVTPNPAGLHNYILQKPTDKHRRPKKIRRIDSPHHIADWMQLPPNKLVAHNEEKRDNSSPDKHAVNFSPFWSLWILYYRGYVVKISRRSDKRPLL